MTSATLLFLVLILLSVPDVKSSESLFKLKCQPAVGVIGQTTHISCIELYTKPKPVVINTVTLTRGEEKKSCFAFQPFENIQTGDSRFGVENGPSLQLHNTAISDEGKYWYLIRTNLGKDQVQFTISVTAKYSNPIITSVQKEIVNDGAVDLYCSANGGYPAGTIHWFDQSNTNWTKSATLQSTQGNDGLFTLSSKLSFQKIDSLWAPFRCVVLNNRYEEEGGTTSTLEIKAKYSNPIITSVPKEIVNNGAADLYCSASGGYPAGTIHWFDRSNTNWTKSATLQSMQGNDGLFTLSSKLSFQKIDSLWAPFRCVVLNNRYEEEGGTTSTLERKDLLSTSDSTVKNKIAPCVVVIGSVIIAVLIALLIKRRCNQQLKRASSRDIFGDFSKEPADVQKIKGLNEPVYKKAADTEENIAV